MIVRWLWLALALIAWWFVRSLLRRRSGYGAGPRPTMGGPPRRAEMVRDRECNTYLPRESAIAVESDGETHIFCSDASRRSFLTRGGPAPG